MTLRVSIIASGQAYQDAAAWAAPTFARFLENPTLLAVLIPEQEKPTDLLQQHSSQYGFAISHFPLKLVSKRKFTSQLKCQGFYTAVSMLKSQELIFLVDADTYCLKPLTLERSTINEILNGNIGMVPDVNDNHFQEPGSPWFLSSEERTTYVNSGVILVSHSSIPLFEKFLELSVLPQFLHGPFNDQKVINYALGKFFREKLILLNTKFNGMRRYLSPGTVIGHCAGGAGGLMSNCQRKEHHQQICFSMLSQSP